MCDFHYNLIKKHFGAELLFTDTDSLTYEIKSENVYEEFFKHKPCLVLAIFQKTQSVVIVKMKWSLEK